MKQRDFVHVIETCYALDRDFASWLAAVHDALSPLIDRGLGSTAYRYDVSSGRVVVHEMISHGDAIDAQAMKRSLNTLTDRYVVEGYRALSSTMASEVPGFAEQPSTTHFFAPAGIHDMLVVNAYNPSGQGICVGGYYGTRGHLSARDRIAYCRVAAHIAAGFRLHERLARLAIENASSTDDGEAVVTPDGQVVHAEGDARLDGARVALSNAARSIDEARGKLRRRDPDEALGRWRTLVSAQWTLVERVESDGKRYLVARANAGDVPESRALTPRERQVLTYAAMGHHNKLIAYELGLAASTVRVLVMRAAQKLGTTTREATIGKFRESARARGAEE